MSIKPLSELLKKKLHIIQGEDRLVKITLFKGECEPFDLSGVTEIAMIFPLADGTELIKLSSLSEVSIVSPAAGKIQASLTDTDTNAMRKAKDQDFKVKIDIGTETRIIKFNDCLTVEGC